ncbi:uncharacterized protein Tco025E_04070 [Trypanosoma conorhini]|uniref:Uncharacterized protein n=1 Tax=Trypanosoma conorhini TaxID=83891 RepID=A0A422PQ34_9TRYP|nr:uncharacterized protein Tco025E_04070 [Trypanosoma conorhini]RNF19831.1 hypothetical protein Tco025E_04070 [Trypanosoma conorhini]
MRHHAAAVSWNHLVPAATATATASVPRHHKTREQEENGGASATQVVVSGWEEEALRRYRKLQMGLTNISSQCEYASSSASSGALLQLILRSKLLPVTDWRECAREVGSWFHGPQSPPVGLLSYFVTHLVVAHKLTPHGAANWILELSKVLLIGDMDTIELGGLASVRSWGLAAELERTVYALQSTETSLFNTFSSVMLDLLLGGVLSGQDASGSWQVLSLCFLLKRNKDFVQSAWEADEKRHCTRLQRACELGCEVPPYIAAVITAVV